MNHVWQAQCKIRISAHTLKVETDRYAKTYIDKSQRLCKKCILNKVEDEEHFICQCPFYNFFRKKKYDNILIDCKKNKS